MNILVAGVRVPTGITVVVLLAGLASACGTTSSLQPKDSEEVIDLTPYKRLLIEDFADEATANAKPKVQPLVELKMKEAVKTFPNQIAAVVTANGGFEEVSREGTVDSETLILRGAITQFDEGNATLRWMVGFNAGNSNFDARLVLVDGGTGRELGTWIVDKNSWALGGGIAATQRPEDFMAEAASKIGQELSIKRKEGQVKKPVG